MNIPLIRIGMTPEETRQAAGEPHRVTNVQDMMREQIEKAVASGKVAPEDVPTRPEDEPEDDEPGFDAGLWYYRDLPEPGNELALTFKDGRVVMVGYYSMHEGS